VGRIIEVAADGRPKVQFDGAPGPVFARVAVALTAMDPPAASTDVPVLLIFENGNPQLPIIIGLMRDTLAAAAALPPRGRIDVPGERGKSFELNGRTLLFEGQDEIVLRCGLGSLTIRANGQVIVKGTKLMSKASETNKIRGASVLIN
jgi:hypothetical protein